MKTPLIPTKDELERQKLALEIRELQRRWWQRPVYLSILLPIVIAFLTVLAGILSGYFDRERAKLRSEISALEEEKAKLMEMRDLIGRALGWALVEAFKDIPSIDAPPTPTPSPN